MSAVLCIVITRAKLFPDANTTATALISKLLYSEHQHVTDGNCGRAHCWFDQSLSQDNVEEYVEFKETIILAAMLSSILYPKL